MNRFIAPAIITAGVMLFAVPARAQTVNVPCGASINAAIAANPAGTTFNLAANCTYSGQTFSTKNNITLKGAGAGSTILDGGSTAAFATNGMPAAITGGDGTTGVTIDSMTIQNYVVPVAVPAH